LAAAVSVMVALPLPDAGDTVKAELLLEAVHADGEQPAGDAVSTTFWDPPPDPKDTVAGATLNAHATVTPIVCFEERPK